MYVTQPNCAQMKKLTTPLHDAAYRCDLAIMKKVVESGTVHIDQVAYGLMNPIHVVCAQSNFFPGKSTDCLDFLIQNGADINVGDIDEMTPLMHSAYALHPENIQMLLRAGADSRLQNHCQQGSQTAFTIACLAYHQRYLNGESDDRSKAAIILLRLNGGDWTKETRLLESFHVSTLLLP
jgi:ankyrin repeat protein